MFTTRENVQKEEVRFYAQYTLKMGNFLLVDMLPDEKPISSLSSRKDNDVDF